MQGKSGEGQPLQGETTEGLEALAPGKARGHCKLQNSVELYSDSDSWIKAARVGEEIQGSTSHVCEG